MNSGLARARIISKKTAVRENSFANMGFPIARNLIFGRRSEKASSFLTESQ